MKWGQGSTLCHLVPRHRVDANASPAQHVLLQLSSDSPVGASNSSQQQQVPELVTFGHVI